MKTLNIIYLCRHQLNVIIRRHRYVERFPFKNNLHRFGSNETQVVAVVGGGMISRAGFVAVARRGAAIRHRFAVHVSRLWVCNRSILRLYLDIGLGSGILRRGRGRVVAMSLECMRVVAVAPLAANHRPSDITRQRK